MNGRIHWGKALRCGHRHRGLFRSRPKPFRHAECPTFAHAQALTVAVAARCRLRIAQGSPRQALLALQQHLPQLESVQAPTAGLQSLWLLMLAAAAAGAGPEAADVLAQVRLGLRTRT